MTEKKAYAKLQPVNNSRPGSPSFFSLAACLPSTPLLLRAIQTETPRRQDLIFPNMNKKAKRAVIDSKIRHEVVAVDAVI